MEKYWPEKVFAELVPLTLRVKLGIYVYSEKNILHIVCGYKCSAFLLGWLLIGREVVCSL